MKFTSFHLSMFIQIISIFFLFLFSYFLRSSYQSIIENYQDEYPAVERLVEKIFFFKFKLNKREMNKTVQMGEVVSVDSNSHTQTNDMNIVMFDQQIQDRIALISLVGPIRCSPERNYNQVLEIRSDQVFSRRSDSEPGKPHLNPNP